MYEYVKAAKMAAALPAGLPKVPGTGGDSRAANGPEDAGGPEGGAGRHKEEEPSVIRHICNVILDTLAWMFRQVKACCEGFWTGFKNSVYPFKEACFGCYDRWEHWRHPYTRRMPERGAPVFYDSVAPAPRRAAAPGLSAAASQKPRAWTGGTWSGKKSGRSALRTVEDPGV